jgi:hypothetical protein
MTNTKSFLAKTTAIACLGLREGLGPEPSHVLGVRGGLLVRSYRVSARWFLWRAIIGMFAIAIDCLGLLGWLELEPSYVLG